MIIPKVIYKESLIGKHRNKTFNKANSIDDKCQKEKKKIEQECDQKMSCNIVVFKDDVWI